MDGRCGKVSTHGSSSAPSLGDGWGHTHRAGYAGAAGWFDRLLGRSTATNPRNYCNFKQAEALEALGRRVVERLRWAIVT